MWILTLLCEIAFCVCAWKEARIGHTDHAIVVVCLAVLAGMLTIVLLKR